MPDDDADYGMVLPFVTVASKGGPHEDQAYTAGWEMGRLDADLGQLAQIACGRSATLTVSMRSDNRLQADLIAMHHGFTTSVVECGECSDHGEWVTLLFTVDTSGPHS